MFKKIRSLEVGRLEDWLNGYLLPYALLHNFYRGSPMTCTRNKKIVPKQAADNSHVTISRTNALAGLPVREPFERYGGDAYFDENWHPVMIIDEGLSKLEEDSKKDCSKFLETNFSSLSLSDFSSFQVFFFLRTLWSRILVKMVGSEPSFVSVLHSSRWWLWWIICVSNQAEMGWVKFVCLKMKQYYHILKWVYWEIVPIINLINDNNSK